LAGGSVFKLNADVEFAQYVAYLFEELFGITPTIRKRPNQNTLVVVGSGISLIEFIMSKGIVRGNKVAQQFDIPNWIKNNPEYQRYFVRGVVDTDGGLYTHRHKVGGKEYVNLGFCFTSYSKNLLYSVANIFEHFGVKPHIDKREHGIYLYSERAVLKYIEVFGTSNPRLSEKFLNWRGV
jgi:hypothetical protein